MNIPIDIDFTVDIGKWKRAITSETGKRILPEPAIRIFRGDKNFKIKVLKDGEFADLSSIEDFSLTMKDPDHLNSNTLLAESSSSTLSSNVLEIVMDTATAEVDTFLGDYQEKSVVLELNALDGQGINDCGPLFHSRIKLRADCFKNDDSAPSVSGNELDLGDVGNSLELDFDKKAFVTGKADQTSFTLSFSNIPTADIVKSKIVRIKNTSGSDSTITVPTGVFLAVGQIMDTFGGKDFTFANNNYLIIVARTSNGEVSLRLEEEEELT